MMCKSACARNKPMTEHNSCTACTRDVPAYHRPADSTTPLQLHRPHPWQPQDMPGLEICARAYQPYARAGGGAQRREDAEGGCSLYFLGHRSKFSSSLLRRSRMRFSCRSSQASERGWTSVSPRCVVAQRSHMAASPTCFMASGSQHHMLDKVLTLSSTTRGA